MLRRHGASIGVAQESRAAVCVFGARLGFANIVQERGKLEDASA
jgi:hypothetical protein